LRAYSIFKKDIGYCQGMSAIVGLLCFHMEEEDAFWTIVQLSDNYGLSEVWKPGLPGLIKCFYVLEKLEEQFMPKLYGHLQAQQLWTSMYATTWFVTVFLYNVPFTHAMRIWDIFLYEGFSFLYALGLAFLGIFEEEMLSMEFEELVCLLQISGASNKSFDFDELLKRANFIKAEVKEAAKVFEHQYSRKMKTKKSKKDKKTKSSKKEKKEKKKDDGKEDVKKAGDTKDGDTKDGEKKERKHRNGERKESKHKNGETRVKKDKTVKDGEEKVKKVKTVKDGEEKVKKVRKERSPKDGEKKVKKEKKERRSKTLAYTDKSLMVPPIVISGQAC